MKEIKKEIEEKYSSSDLSKEDKQQLCYTAYNLTKDMNKKGYTPPQMLAFAPAIGLGGMVMEGMSLSATALRIAKAVEVAISLKQGVDAIAQHAKDIGVGSNSNDSNSIKPFATNSNDGKVESDKGETKDNKSTSTGGGGSNKEPDDPNKKDLNYKIGSSNASDEIGRTERHGKIYKDPLKQKWGNKDIWLSKDNSSHGGMRKGVDEGGVSHKVYVETNTGFEKIAELDKTGKVMSKHMSKVGDFISKKDLIWIKR